MERRTWLLILLCAGVGLMPACAGCEEFGPEQEMPPVDLGDACEPENRPEPQDCVFDLDAEGIAVSFNTVLDSDALQAICASPCTTLKGQSMVFTSPEPGGDNPLEAISHIRHIDARVEIREVAGLEDLSALAALESMLGEIFVVENPDLTSLSGLDAAPEVPSLRVRSNPKLRTVGPFPSAQAMVALELLDNPELTEVVGLEGVLETEGLIDIRDSPKLTSLAGFRSLTHARSLSLENTGLSNFADLGALEEVHRSIRVVRNARLDAFELTSLQRLNPRSPEAASLRVVDNPGLPPCEVDGLIEQVDFKGTSFLVEGNTGEGDCSQ